VLCPPPFPPLSHAHNQRYHTPSPSHRARTGTSWYVKLIQMFTHSNLSKYSCKYYRPRMQQLHNHGGHDSESRGIFTSQLGQSAVESPTAGSKDDWTVSSHSTYEYNLNYCAQGSNSNCVANSASCWLWVNLREIEYGSCKKKLDFTVTIHASPSPTTPTTSTTLICSLPCPYNSSQHAHSSERDSAWTPL